MEALVGREAEVGKLEFALAEAELGGGRLVLLSGEPGIGKSRLAEELARRAKARGLVTAWGRAWEADGTPPHWPWVEALRALGASEEARDVLADARRESPELDALLGRSAGPVDESDGATFRLHAAVAQFLADASARTPVLILLEDLHVADAATLDLLAFVARRLRSTRALCVATTRDAAFVASPEGLTRLARVAREATPISLGGLSKQDVARLVAESAPSLAASLERVYESSGGNPLFVRELVESWKADPDARALPLGIRDAIRAHIERLTSETRRMLEVASVLGREVRLDAWRALADSSRDEFDEGLGRALASSIVHRVDEGRVRFAHVLLRDELYASVPARERAALHRAAAKRFAAESAALAAHHALIGADATSADEAASLALAAMREAAATFATDDAVALGARARAVLAEWLSPARECALLVALGEMLIHAGASAEGQRFCLIAADRAEAHGDGSLVARAALAYASDQGFGHQPDSVAILRRARAALGDGDTALHVRVLARLACALTPPPPGEKEEPIALARRAIAMARSLGDEQTVLSVFTTLGAAFPEEFSPDERFELRSMALSLAIRLGQTAHVPHLSAWQVFGWLEVGRLDRARDELAATEERFASLPPRVLWRLKLLRGTLASVEGRFDEASALAREVLSDDEGARFATIQLMVLPYLRGEAGDFAEIEPTIGRIQRAIPGSRAFMSISDATLGRVERVREAIQEIRATHIDSIPGVEQLGWPILRVGLVEHADFFFELTRARAAKAPLSIGPGALSTFGPRDLLAGRLALLAGRHDDALEHLGRALAFCTRLGAAPYLAHTELALAEVHAAKGSAASARHAEAAIAHAERVGMRAVADQARALAGRTPISRRASTPPASSPSRSVAVTRRGELWAVACGEREVLLSESRGVAYLEALVGSPHREVHVLELVGEEGDGGDAGPLLDEAAKRAYRERAEEAREEIDEATRFGDLARAEKARRELDALGEELARAVGLGGRDRRAASRAERARINVQRRLKDVVRKVASADKELGRHLELSLKTGVFCVYAPTWPASER